MYWIEVTPIIIIINHLLIQIYARTILYQCARIKRSGAEGRWIEDIAMHHHHHYI